MFTRKNQLWWLIGLSAIAAMAQYVVQGAAASGHNPGEFAWWFWYLDFGLWGARALIEAWCIVYLFSTQAETRMQSAILTIFEVALIGLITLTLGPTMRSLGYGMAMRESLAEPYFTFWNFGIAAYTSLMMGAAGYAYRVQPEDETSHTQLSAAQELISDLQAELINLEAGQIALQTEVDAARAAVQTVSAFAAMPSNLQVKWIAENRNGAGPNNAELARIFGVNPSTITRWIKGE